MTAECIRLSGRPGRIIGRLLFAARGLRNQIHSFFKMAALEAPGDESAICRSAINQRAEQLLLEYGNAVLRLAYSYLHNISDAEEILQDALIQFLKSKPSFENKDHEKAWLLRVAGNLAKNKIKSNQIRGSDQLSETLAAEETEDLSFVWDAVKQLPVKYREVIHLFYYEGYTTAQIAGILKKNEATVRSHLSRGRSRLKEILKEVYDFERTVS